MNYTKLAICRQPIILFKFKHTRNYNEKLKENEIRIFLMQKEIVDWTLSL